MADNFSIVEYFGYGGGHRCGYCGNSDSSKSHGMWAHKMTCQDYQDLINRGWRRSGKYVYKPQLCNTCCPAYTIRCGALQFKISKSQKKVLKKMTKFLTVPETETAAANEVSEERTTDTKLSTDADHQENCSEDEKQVFKHSPAPGVGADPNRPPCRKAKQIRLERKQQKLANQQSAMLIPDKSKVVPESKGQEAKSLEDLLVERLPDKDPVHRLEVKLVRVDMESPDFRDYFKKAHKVFEKYQIAIHHEQKDDCDREQFQRFLIDSPLVHHKSADGPAEGYGSFHQQYHLDGKLIAVGVLDILPSCVSSVYFFYDPDYSFLSLGVYSALRELSLTRSLQQQSPNLKFYYMGFYIHSCPKMRYKGQYFPSYLVCPETYEWVPIEKCRPKLDGSKYSRLSDNSLDPPKTDVNHVMILYDRQAMPYQIFKMISGMKGKEETDAEVEEYANLVGPLVVPRMLLFRSL